MLTVYKEWLSEDGKTIVHHTLKDWFTILNIKPVTINNLQRYSTTEKQYASYGFIDIYYNGYGINHNDINNYMNIEFYGVNADIKMLSLKPVYKF